MLKIKKIGILMLIVSLLGTLFSSCYATHIEVTKENLTTSLQQFASSDTNEENYKMTVGDNIITITADEVNCILNYDLTEKPTFSIEIPIEQGMSYAEYKEQIDNLTLPMIGYIATANIQGVDFDDASIYLLMSYLDNALDGSSSSEDSYVIYDDTDVPEGVTIEKDESNTKIIYASEFGERVMEYVNATYKDKQTIKDSSDGINSYEWTTERKDITDTSCKLVSSLSVNLDADFSELNGYSDKISESLLNKDVTEENADYAITLKVGQKCRIETSEKITGYELSGAGCEYSEINDNCAEIIGKSVGKTNGYIYFGEIKKSMFITVENNDVITNLDTLELEINIESETDQDDESNQQEEEKTNINNNNKNDETTDSTTAKTNLPQTGVSNIICIVIIFNLVLIIIFRIKLKKYRDIK